MPSPEDCATLQAIGDGVEHARTEAEREWGAERLPLLVSNELRAKFNRQKRLWSDAYRSAWESQMLTRDQLDAVEGRAGGMKRAYAALAVAATEAGHRPIIAHAFETMLADGSVLAVVQTNDEAAKVLADGRCLHVYTMAEVAHLVDALVPESLKLAKTHFPGARFQASTQFEYESGWVAEGDSIPFPASGVAA